MILRTGTTSVRVVCKTTVLRRQSSDVGWFARRDLITWAAAKELPPHLATIVPAAAAHPGLDYPSTQNVGLTCMTCNGYTFTSGRTGQQNLFGDQKFWRTKFLDAYKKHIPFKSLDSFVGNPSVNLQRILKHPTLDAHYDAMVPTREQFQNHCPRPDNHGAIRWG